MLVADRKLLGTCSHLCSLTPSAQRWCGDALLTVQLGHCWGTPNLGNPSHKEADDKHIQPLPQRKTSSPLPWTTVRLPSALWEVLPHPQDICCADIPGKMGREQKQLRTRWHRPWWLSLANSSLLPREHWLAFELFDSALPYSSFHLKVYLPL